MISDFKQIYDLIDEWATNEPEAGTFIYGHLMLLPDYINRSSTRFPIVYWEEPKVTSVYGDPGSSNFYDRFDMGVWFVVNYKHDEQEDVIAGGQEMWGLMNKFHKYLVAKDEEHEFLGRGGMVEKEPLDPMVMTKVVGWRMSFEIQLTSNNYLFNA